MSNALKRIWSITTTVIVIIVVILALLLVGARVVGYQVFAVLSGSMEPTYHTGSLIYVKEVDPFTLQAGDAITFMLDEDTTATHRIVGVVPDEEDPSTIRFRTKGDANDFEDATLVHYKNVIGVPKFTIPKLGYISNFIQHPPGMYYAIAMAAVLLLLTFLPDLLDDDKPKEKKRSGKKPPSDEERAPKVRRERKAPVNADLEMYEKLYGSEPLPEKKPKARKKVSPSVGSADESLPCVKGGGSAQRRRRDCNKKTTTPQSALRASSSPYTGEPPRPKRPAPVVEEEMTFDLEDILADFRSE